MSGTANKDGVEDSTQSGIDLSQSFSQNSPAPKIVPLSHVAVKSIPFSTKHPETWFRQMESQFHLARVSSKITKYHHVVAALPEEVIYNIPADIGEDYELLKQNVIESLKGNKHQLIEQALGSVSLEGKRPTQVINDIKRRFADVNITPDEALIKSRLLTALPQNIRAALVGHDNEPLDNYARIADSMLAVAGSNPYSIDAASASTTQLTNTMHECSISRDNREINHVQNNNWRSNNSYNHQRNFDSRQPRQFTSSVRPFHRDQRPRICNAHIFYAEHARTCRQWCKWPIKNQRVLKPFEKTPAQSRSSSPSKN